MSIRGNVARAAAACALVVGVASCGGGDGGSGPTYTVGGTITGLVGTAVLRLNGGNDLTVTAPGSFTFASALAVSAAYAVTASAAQNCNVSNGSGTVGSANVTNVAINCTTVVRTAVLSGASENPANASTATGRGALIVDPTTKVVTGGITFSGLTPTTGGHHIHQAPAGNAAANGSVIIGLVLAPGGGVATVPAGTVLTDAQYTALLAGELYFNVHTTANPGGEIRGAISGRGGVVAALASLDGAQEVPATASTATGRGMIVFDATTRDVLVGYVTHTVTAPTVAHIHTGAVGVSGPANVATLSIGAAGSGIFTAPGPATLSAQGATDISNGNTYFNVHSTTNAGGEIRGQLVVQ